MIRLVLLFRNLAEGCKTEIQSSVAILRYRDILTYMNTKAKSSKSKPSLPIGDVASFSEAAECLRILAHPVRLRLVQILLHGRFSVGELAEDCDVPDNVASEHLRLLQRCGFLGSEREGRHVYYIVVEPHLKTLMACMESRFLSARIKS